MTSYVYMLDGKLYKIEAPNLAEATGLAWKNCGKRWRDISAIMSKDAYEKLTGRKLG